MRPRPSFPGGFPSTDGTAAQGASPCGEPPSPHRPRSSWMLSNVIRALLNMVHGTSGIGKACRRRKLAAFAAAVNQSMAIEHRVHGADGRGVDIAMEPPELLADLRSAPAGALALELNDQLLDLKGQLVGLPVGPSTAIA